MEKGMIQQKDCESWWTDCRVNMSANLWEEQGERQSEEFIAKK